MTAPADAAPDVPTGWAAPPAEEAVAAVAAARAAAADAAVTSRHPDLPGLALVLDVDALRTALAALGPAEVAATAVVERLRVKPGASVRAGVRLDGPAGRSPRVLVTARAADDWEAKARKEVDAARRAELPACVEPATRVLLAPAAADRPTATIVHGRADDVVPLPLSEGLVAAHPWIGLEVVEGDHMDVIDPGSTVWPVVRRAVLD